MITNHTIPLKPILKGSNNIFLRNKYIPIPEPNLCSGGKVLGTVLIMNFELFFHPSLHIYSTKVKLPAELSTSFLRQKF